MTQAAARLGSAFGSAETFAQECSECSNREVLCDVLAVAALLACKTPSSRSYQEYVLQHVMPSAIRRSFYLRAPLDHFLIPLHDAEAFERAGNVFPFLARVARYEDAAPRVACVMVPVTSRALTTTLHVADACDFLIALGAHAEPRRMLREPLLFHSLASRANLATIEKIIEVVRAAGVQQHHDLAYPVVLAAGDLLRVMRPPPSAPPSAQAVVLSLLEECAALDVWKRSVTPIVAGIASSGWPTIFARLLHAVLLGPSVHFVLYMHAKGCLTGLIRRAFLGDSEAAWHGVREQLMHQWPGMVALITNQPLDPAAPVTSYCCPITLDGCRRPVVASDGHTYERDAILRHMSTRSMESPITRVSLLPYLFDNHALT